MGRRAVNGLRSQTHVPPAAVTIRTVRINVRFMVNFIASRESAAPPSVHVDNPTLAPIDLISV